MWWRTLMGRHRPYSSLVDAIITRPSRSTNQRLEINARRFLSSSSSSGPPWLDPELSAFLTAQGIDKELHAGIVKTLQVAFGNHMKVEHLKLFGESGLQDLAKAVKQEVSRNVSSRPSKKVHFTIPHHRTEFDLRWRLGDSLLDVIQSPAGSELLSEYIEATCGGNASCCTCHVYVDKKTYAVLPPPISAELDMLDLAFEPKDTSRLSCQVVLTQDLLDEEDLEVTVTIPSSYHDVWA